MDENILGLKIVRIKEGYRDLLEINGDMSWTNKVWDIRHDLPSGTNTSEGQTILLLSNTKSGSIITIAASIEGRQNDCISAWIFVPMNLEIGGKQLVEVISETKKELIANERNDEKLHKIYDKKYEVSNALRTPIVNTGEQFAFRKYGRGSCYELYELLDNPYQPDYQPFKGIFLIDNTSSISPTGTDLSNLPLKEFVQIDAVPVIDGFQAFINNQNVSKAPITLPKGEEVTIIWKRAGYKTVKKEWSVKPGEPVPTVNEADFYAIVSFSKFVVKDGTSNLPISDYSIKIDNRYLEEGREFYVHELVLKNCPVSFDAPGYRTFGKAYDLSQNKIVVYLDKEKHTYDMKVELQYDDNHYANLHVETTEKLNGRSPIAGYRRNNDYLYYKPFGIKQIAFAGLALLVSLLLGFCGGRFLISKPSESEPKPESEKVTDNNITQSGAEEPLKETDDKYDAIRKIVNYLDNNEKWNRNEMEKFSEISGLWDALNERRFDDILGHEEQLKASTKFRELVIAINVNKHKQFKNNYNSEPSDYDITIGSKDTPGSYIKKLYDANEPGSSGTGTLSQKSDDAGKGDTKQKTIDNQDEF